MSLRTLLSSAQCLWQISSFSVTSAPHAASHHSNIGVWEEREQNEGSNLFPPLFFYSERICVCGELIISYWLRVDTDLMAEKSING